MNSTFIWYTKCYTLYIYGIIKVNTFPYIYGK